MKSLLPLLVRLFPAEFRRQFGDDLLAQVHADLDRASARGRLRAFGSCLVIGLDLVRCAVAERLNPTWASPPVASNQRKESRWPMNGLMKDLGHSIRTLRRSPGFTVIAVGTLGLAIGVNAGIFSVIDTVLLDPLPYAHRDRLVHIAASAPGSDLPDEFGVSAEFFVHYSEQAKLLEDISTYNSGTSTLRVGDRTERVRMSWPTTSLFRTLGATPILGRLPVPEDEDRVAVISHALWTTWFGADPAVIGRSYYMSGSNRTIIGVMGPEFWFPRDDVMLWIPQVIHADEIVPGDFGIPLVGRMSPDATPEAVSSELARLARQLPERFGGSANYVRVIERHRPVVGTLEAELLGDVSRPLWILLGSVGVVLLIACANVANLFMVRAERRQRDLAIRRAIGAGRGRLMRSEMAEVVIVAALAGVLAVAIAWVSMPLLIQSRQLEQSGMTAVSANIPRLGDVALTLQTLLFTLGVSVFSALLCGLMPALRSSSPNLTRLRDGSRGSTRRRHGARDALVAAQAALALVLLIGSGLLMRSFQALQNVDPGYDTEDIFTFQIAPEGNDLTDGPSYARFHMSFMERVAALPGVESVGVVTNVPLNEGTSNARFRTAEMAADPDGGTLLNFTWAGGDYFATMGISVLAGRAFTDADHVSSLGNVVISRSAANLLWPNEDPIGKRLQAAGLETPATVRSRVIRPIRDGQPVAEFVPEVVHLPSGSCGWPEGEGNSLRPRVRFTVAMTVPVFPADEANLDVVEYPERRVVHIDGAGPPAAGETKKDSSLRETLLDWSAIRNSSGGWTEFRDRVLKPVLLAFGHRIPEARIEVARPDLTEILDSLGWARAVDAVYRIAPYLAEKRNPVAYLCKAMRGTNEPVTHASPATPPRSRPPASVERPLAEPSRAVTSNANTKTDNKALERLTIDKGALLASWLDDLRGSPSRLIARQALEFVRDRRSSRNNGNASDEKVLLEIERLATQALGKP